MNISKEQVDDLNAVVNIELEPGDYTGRVDQSIREHARKINMPGFRPGKVPAGLVKKMYGKSILAEEVNKILNDSLFKYLEEQKISYLGNPLPKEDDNTRNNFDEPGNFRFSYELGLTPQFEVKIDPKKSFTYEKVSVDDELIDKEITALRTRYGKVVPAEKAGKEDILSVQVSIEGEQEEPALIEKKNATIFLNRSTDEVKAMFDGAEPGKVYKADPHKIWPEPEVLARILNLPEEIAADLNKEATIEVQTVHKLEPAELNEEFFTKIYGPDTVNSEEELKEKVRQEIEAHYGQESDRRFFKEVNKYLLNETSVPLPEEFLKRWIKAVNEKPLDDHQLDHEFSHYREHLQWELIGDRILQDHEIKIESSEVLDFVKEELKKRYREYGIQDIPEQELDNSARKVLSKREEARAAYDSLREQKLLELFKRSYKLEIKETKPESFNQNR